MKALSVRQPWADLILFKEKTIETRTWKTNYRGEILIVASKKPHNPRAGFALCIVKLVDCRPMVKADEAAAKCEIYPGAYAWVLEFVRQVPFLPVPGKLGIYDVKDYPFKIPVTACRECGQMMKDGCGRCFRWGYHCEGVCPK